MDTDKRRWHIDKGIPVALIVSMASALFLGGIAYQSIRGEQTKQSESLEETRAEVKDLRKEMSALAAKQIESRSPSEKLEWLVSQLRAEVTDLKGVFTEGSRHRQALESRVQRLENAQSSTAARARVRDER